MTFEPNRYKLSPHFTLGEFLVSATAARAGKQVELLPELDQEIIDNLKFLCETVLEPLRESVRKPIVIISGYRPPWLNKLVGGSKTSDHMTGCAADLIIPNMRTVDVCHKIKSLALPFKQLINEFPPSGWVHVSAVKGVEPKYQTLTAFKQGRKTIYLGGILS